MQNMIIHADDYGMNPEASGHILECIDRGGLSGVSVLPNSRYLFPCLKLLNSNDQRIKLNLHFNLAEGSSLTGRSMLTDEAGMFNLSFLKILILSLTPKRRKMKALIKAEFKAQLRAYEFAVSKAGLSEAAFPLRLDSHQHYHMIPLVLECIMEVLKEEKREIGFLRIPAEPLSPFIKNPRIFFSCPLINLVKNLVLNALALLQSRRLAPLKKRTALFFGIMMSGEMDKKRVKTLLPYFKKMADEKKVPIEVLAHPGGISMKNVDKLMDPDNALCREFYTSENRRVEKNMILNLMLYQNPGIDI
ncbi:MAG: ChbG/HpnK family deacetylase [Lachnospiraceae bacterium]|nr:ChbG/HpnK family deacetylase [Lachnospiraceae bacterium]